MYIPIYKLIVLAVALVGIGMICGDIVCRNEQKHSEERDDDV